MMLNNEDFRVKTPQNKIGQYIKKNGLTIVLILGCVIMLVSPEAKAFVLRQLINTGLFNASIENKENAISPMSSIDFDFSDENGKVSNTVSLRGKVVFINFWASWCPPCRAEFSAIEKLYARFKDNPDVYFLSMNEDNELATGKAYFEKEKFSMSIYMTAGNIPEEIYTGSLPTTIVLDKTGRIRYHHTGIANYASAKFIRQIEKLIEE